MISFNVISHLAHMAGSASSRRHSLERIFIVFDVRFAVFPPYGYDIKAARACNPMPLDIVLSKLPKFGLLAQMHTIFWPNPVQLLAGLHFDEHARPLLIRDQVNLSE
jgi:hypothetical protein